MRTPSHATPWFRALLVALALAGCAINPIPTPGGDAISGATDVGGVFADMSVSPPADTVAPGTDAPLAPDLAAPEDSAASDDIATPTDVRPPRDVPVTPPDVRPTITVTGNTPTAACEAGGAFVGGTLRVTLRWSTSKPATCELAISVAGQETRTFGFGETQAGRSHQFLYALTAYEWGERAPAVGDTIVFAALCTGTDGAYGDSAPMTLPLDAGRLACLWPYDGACSDGSTLLCRAALPVCEGARVPALVGGCGRCVFPATCGCDDGAPSTCAEPATECPAGRVLATQEGCTTCVDERTCADETVATCPTLVGATAACAFQYTEPSADPHPCVDAECLLAPCAGDADCPRSGADVRGSTCVLGSCVFCWQDDQCPGPERCRAGRCVSDETPACPAPAPCIRAGCRLVTPSEQPCPVCVCDTPFDKPCETDEECLVYSSHPYRRCVYGRCADCRSDDDCTHGRCLPPGVCYAMTPDVESLYGTWLVGWAGGLDHFSYVRFEPDGTFRRGRYVETGSFADDVPSLPCDVGTPLTTPLLGTWEPEITQSGFLVVRVALNVPCDSGEGWGARWAVTLGDDETPATFRDIDEDTTLTAYPVEGGHCAADMSLCDEPRPY